VLRVDGARYQVEDLGSSNGTLLRGQRVAGKSPLRVGETLRIGGYAVALVESPLMSLWARAILAETAQGDRPVSDLPMPTALLPATAPLSQVLLRQAELEPSDRPSSSAAEERIESLLRAAWHPDELDRTFNERAMEAVLLSAE
jgi:pSer/pThr/pTyr-binding forkhead associated (FHA) protein